jgi:peroxiredoxin
MRIASLSFCLALVSVVGAAEPTAPSIKRCDLLDAAGKRHTEAEWRDRKAVVLFFLATECPVSNGYAPEMTRIAKTYGPKGVAVFGVHPDPDVTADAATAHAGSYKLSFPVLLDPTQTLSTAAGVKRTPEVVVLSNRGDVLYRGRIDDRYDLEGRRREEPTTYDLRTALDAVLAGGKPAVATTKAFGCPLPPAAGR